jgi:hypothetical protein
MDYSVLAAQLTTGGFKEVLIFHPRNGRMKKWMIQIDEQIL